MFSWIPIYEELAKKLVEYRDRQKELIRLIKEMHSEGVKVFSMRDKDAEGNAIELEEVDPFTFFASFNRGITKEGRQDILRRIKEHFGLAAPIPDEFDGIPVVMLFSSWFFSYKSKRKEDDIQQLWALHEALITTNTLDEKLFNRCLEIRMLSIAKLTVGLYWTSPSNVLPYDSRTQKYLADHGIHLESKDYQGYSKLVESVKSRINKPFYEVSHEAYKHGTDHLLHNQLIAKVLGEDRNCPYNVWKERVEKILLPIFTDLNGLVAEAEIEVGKARRYKRTTKDTAKDRHSIYSIRWELLKSSPKFGNKKIEFYICFGDRTQGWEHSIWWGVNWWGKEEYAGNIYEFFDKIQTDEKLIRNDDHDLFGGTFVSLIQKRYSAEQVKEMDHDIKHEIVEDCAKIVGVIDSGLDDNGPEPKPNGDDYAIEKALSDLFMNEKDFREIVAALDYRKNIILQGPPGVGKTFVAKRLAFAMMGKKDHSRVEMIQFHQSYGYEDFIQGYRPTDDGGFELKYGAFYHFVKRAQTDRKRPYFFVIDEINRANLGKVFGELMMLIEADKRGEEFAIPLTYSKDGTERFFIPENLHLIGTMNTADRSITIVDYALRRRFAFFSLKPEFGEKFMAHLGDLGVDKDVLDQLISRVKVLNDFIAADKKNLGPGFEIGHSFFCPLETVEDSRKWYNRIISLEIKPQLFEYWFDDPERAEERVELLYI